MEQPDPENHWHDLGSACEGCACTLIAKVREDEAETEWENVEKGYFYGIALCIAAINELSLDSKTDSGLVAASTVLHKLLK
jgi:hypothetical protein